MNLYVELLLSLGLLSLELSVILLVVEEVKATDCSGGITVYGYCS